MKQDRLLAIAKAINRNTAMVISEQFRGEKGWIHELNELLDGFEKEDGRE